MKHLNAVALDLEMTGLSPKMDKIIEIGACKVCEGEIVDTFQRLVSPGRLLEEGTKQLTGITDDMLKDAEEFSDVAAELLEFLGRDVLLGHNILQDFSFLKRAVINVLPKKSTFERSGIDTLKIARGLLPAQQKKTLTALCDFYQIPHTAHRALGDAKAALLLYEKLWQQFGKDSPEKFAPRPLIYQVKRDTPVMQKQIEQIQRILAQRRIENPYDLAKMTKSEASRYIDSLRNAGSSSQFTGQPVQHHMSQAPHPENEE